MRHLSPEPPSPDLTVPPSRPPSLSVFRGREMRVTKGPLSADVVQMWCGLPPLLARSRI